MLFGFARPCTSQTNEGDPRLSFVPPSHPVEPARLDRMSDTGPLPPGLHVFA